MSKVLALGRVGRVFAEKLNELSNNLYDCHVVDLNGNDSPEEVEGIEMDFAEFDEWIDGASGVLCITSGADSEAALTLRHLERIRNLKIQVAYIRPDLSTLSGVHKLHERTVRHVLQEYARSGMFEVIWLFDYMKIEETIAGEMNIATYDEQIVSVAAQAYYSIDLYKNGQIVPIKSTVSIPYDADRIATIAVRDIKEEKEVVLYPFKLVREKELHYAFPKHEIETNGRVILDIVRRHDAIENGDLPWAVETSYAIYETSYNMPFAYAIMRSSEIQSDDAAY